WKTRVEPFTDQDVELLEIFADQAVIAVETARLFQELKTQTEALTHSVEEMRILGEVGRAVSSTLELQTVLETIITHAVRLSEAHAGTIYEFNEETEVFEPRASYGMSAEIIEILRDSKIRFGEGTVGVAAARREAFQIGDLEQDPTYRFRDVLRRGG